MRPSLFIGSSTESLPVANVLQEQLTNDARVNVWNQGIFGAGQYVLDSVLSAAKQFDFAAFVFGADDTLKSRGNRYLVARDNVVFELGIFAAALGRNRTFIVLQETEEPVRLPSDLQGVIPAKFAWPDDMAFDSNYQMLHGEIGPAAQSIRVAMSNRGPEDHALKPLSGGMVFLALWLRDRGHSLHELNTPFQEFQKLTSRLGPDGYSAKAAKYACQCLEALGIAESHGADEYSLTPSGKQLLKSEKVCERFPNVYDVFESLSVGRR